MGTVAREHDARLDVILRLAAGTELLLIGLTWKLWFCGSQFPRIPLLTAFVDIPDAVVLTVSVVFALLVVLCVIRPPGSATRPARAIGFSTLVAGSLTVCCNQHCLQPWHWLFLLAVVFRMIVPADRVMSVWRVLAATIYIFAALSRVGPKVDEGMNRQVVLTLLNLSGLTTAANDANIVSWLCVGSTLIEFAIGGLLLTRKTERTGMFAGVVFHATLGLALGPLGMQQNFPVLVWNLFLAVWLIALFGRRLSEVSDGGLRGSPAAMLATGFCWVWPTLALISVTDAWTGWQLYSPRPSVVRLQVRTSSIGKIPIAPRLIADPQPLDHWQTVRMDRWSLEEAGVPLYPAARFQLGVAVWLTRDIDAQSGESVRVRVDSPESPIWWKRRIDELPGVSTIRNTVGRSTIEFPSADGR